MSRNPTAQHADGQLGDGRIVDVGIDLDDLDAVLKPRSQHLGERLVCRRIEERAAGDVIRGEPLQRVVVLFVRIDTVARNFPLNINNLRGTVFAQR